MEKAKRKKGVFMESIIFLGEPESKRASLCDQTGLKGDKYS